MGGSISISGGWVNGTLVGSWGDSSFSALCELRPAGHSKIQKYTAIDFEEIHFCIRSVTIK